MSQEHVDKDEIKKVSKGLRGHSMIFENFCLHHSVAVIFIYGHRDFFPFSFIYS